jgi:hypothetical protein
MTVYLKNEILFYIYIDTVILVSTLCKSFRHSVNNVNMPLKQVDSSYIHVKITDVYQTF